VEHLLKKGDIEEEFMESMKVSLEEYRVIIDSFGEKFFM